MLWAMLIAVEHLQITIRLTDPNLMESWSLKDYSMALLFTQNPNSPRYFGLWTRWSQEIGSSVLGILFNRVRFLRLWGLWSLFFIPRPTKSWTLVFDYSSAPRSALPTPTAQESARTTCTLTFTEGRYRNPEMLNRSTMTSLPGVKPGALEYSFSIHHFLPIKASINILLNQYFIISSKTGPTT